MLILTRKLQEGVTVLLPDGRRLRVCLVTVDRGKARLGFEGPPDVKFFRDELLPAERPAVLPMPDPPRVA